VLDDLWLRALHRRMFGDVWTWAGQYRTTERNIGIDPIRITTATRDLVENAAYRAGTTDSEHTRRVAVARFHHQLVAIHPFPNGNGRHARAAADYLAHALDLPAPSWGRHDARVLASVRASYLAALRAADRDHDDLDQLLTFTWS
jgi:Fic-DOC domain mobile mystery protein B